MGDPAVAQSMQRFSKEPVDMYGLKAPQVRKIIAAVVKEVRPWTSAELTRLCEELWKSGKFEEGGIAVETFERASKSIGRREFQLFEKWIDRYVRNWGHCDATSAHLVARALQNEPQLVTRLRTWVKSPNRWKRRAAAVSLVYSARRGEGTSDILRVSRVLLEDGDEMVQKGVGWLLKETYPKKPREVVRFLNEHKSRTTRLVLRYAAEKMTAADKATILG